MATKKSSTKSKTASTKNVAKKATKKAPAKKKSAARKPAAKKSAGKKAASCSKAKIELIYAPDEQMFWVNEGPVLRTLRDLEDAFDVITVAQFKYHVGGDRNDFASWVEYVLFDDACAKDLKKAHTKNVAKKAVAKHLKKYN